MKYVQADITTAPETVIMHGCNMQGKMNSGVAKALRKKYPQIYKDYKSALNEHDLKLGEYVISFKDGGIIANLLTQDRYGYDGKEYASAIAIYDSVKLFLDDMENVYGMCAFPSIAIPKIGCGRGGLYWDDIEQVFKEFEDKYGVEFIVYDIPDEYSKG